jgi:precorrin-2 dehydrogenase/sirohydrochlorin ferrochelatase
MIPLMVDLQKKTVMIFGGGRVGLRKAAFFCKNSDVRVISRSFVPEFSGMGVECIGMDIAALSDGELSSLLDGVFLAVAATTDEEQNNRIGRICSEAGVLFNNARGDPGDVIIPSVIHGENYVLAISTGGSSPAVSRFIREFIERSCPNLDAMIALQVRLRSHLKSSQPDIAKRNELIRDILYDREVWNALEKGEEEAWKTIEAGYL